MPVTQNKVNRTGDTMTGNLTLRAAGVTFAVEGDAGSANLRGFVWGDTTAISPLGQVLLRRARGTIAAPLRTQSGDLMGRVGGTGAHAADDVSAATLLTAAKSYLEFRTAEAFTSTAQGSDIRFFTTPIGSTTAAEQMRLMSFTGKTPCLMIDEIQGYAADKTAKFAVQMASTNRTASFGSLQNTLYSRIVRYGSGDIGDPDIAVFGLAAHHANCSSVAVTGAANNGSGLIRITCASHSFQTGDRVGVGNVGGVTNANDVWTVTRISATQFDLQGSTFAGTYTSGGSATTAGITHGGVFHVTLTTPRVLSGATGGAVDGDDVVGVTVYNGSTNPYSGTTAFYQGHSPVFNDVGEYEWASGFDAAGYNQYWGFGGFGYARIGANGAMFDAARCAYDSGATPLKLPKDNYIRFTDTDGGSNSINFAKYDTGTAAITFGAKVALPDVDLVFGTTTGTKIGTATTQKLGFYGLATPIVQPANTLKARAALEALGLLATGGAEEREFQIKVFDDATALSTGDGKAIFVVPVALNGLNLIRAHAFVTTVSSSGLPTVQIRNITQAADMLSTRITIDVSEFRSFSPDTPAAPPVIDTGNDDVATGDLIAIDVDVAGTGAKGLGVILTFGL